jgi:phage FluMu protein Com
MMMKNKEPQLKVKEVKPQYIAQLCPRCKGYKTVSYGKIPCDMCEQLGYIKIPAEEVLNG